MGNVSARAQAQAQAQATVKPGDMATTTGDRVGLVMETDEFCAKVQFVSNGPWIKYKLSRLRRASAAEIKAAGLHGVGCNEPEGGW